MVGCPCRALAAAPRRRRRLPGARGKDGGVVVEVVGRVGGDSSISLMVEIPFLDEMVKVADSTASSNSSNSRRTFLNSGFISCPDI